MGSLTNLLVGEDGLVKCMGNVFQYGFKSQRLFGRNFYVWDFLSEFRRFYFPGKMTDGLVYPLGRPREGAIRSEPGGRDGLFRQGLLQLQSRIAKLANVDPDQAGAGRRLALLHPPHRRDQQCEPVARKGRKVSAFHLPKSKVSPNLMTLASTRGNI